MESYTYPDKQDKMILQFIREKDENYWIESEMAIIRLIISHFDILLPEARKRFFDAGCGTGRLIPYFESYFDEVVGVEPDPQRYDEAVALIRSLNLQAKTRLWKDTLQAYHAISSESADFILCSHVIQHINSKTVKPFLLALTSMLNHHGLLAITTNHSTKPFNYFMKSFLEDGKTRAAEVDEEEFNEIISGEGILPVQFFNYEILADFLQSLGLKVIEYKVFHVDDQDRDLVKPSLSDDYFNRYSERQEKFGADMLILLQKE